MLTRKLVSIVAAASVALAPAAAGPALLFDATSGRVFYAEDADSQWYPASLAKLTSVAMTRLPWVRPLPPQITPAFCARP